MHITKLTKEIFIFSNGLDLTPLPPHTLPPKPLNNKKLYTIVMKNKCAQCVAYNFIKQYFLFQLSHYCAI